MKKLSLSALLLLSVSAFAAVDFGSPELTTTQPGSGAGANASKDPGKGWLGAITLGHYNIRGINANGQDHASDKYTSLDLILPHLSYYTDTRILGGRYSFGITGVIGGVHRGSEEVGVGVSGSPWLHPIRLNWTVGNDLHVVAGYSVRLGLKSSRMSIDKAYDMHTLNTGVTYDINERWQVNGALQYEHRTATTRNGHRWQAGDIGYVEGSLIRKFDNGMTLGGYAYHIGHLNRDSGVQYDGANYLLMGRYGSHVSALGMEFTTPIEAINSSLSLRVHEEVGQKNHSYGTRGFLTLSHKF